MGIWYVDAEVVVEFLEDQVRALEEKIHPCLFFQWEQLGWHKLELLWKPLPLTRGGQTTEALEPLKSSRQWLCFSCG